MEYFRNLEDLMSGLQVDPSTALDPVKRMFIFDGAHLTVNIASGSGMGNSLHVQPAHEEIVLVLKGEADFRVGEQVRRVGPGDIIFIPGDTVHGRVRTHAEPWIALSIYGPAFDRSRNNIRWGES
jgi:quercetin dioxygenase-like cupin family protein